MKHMMRTLLFAALLTMSGGVTTGESESPDRVPLFNGRNFDGWKLFLGPGGADPADTWRVQDGVIRCTGRPAGYMRTTTAHEDFTLHLEWRFPEKAGNSGVLLHVQEPDAVWPRCIEAQLHSGDAGDFWLIGGTGIREQGDPHTPRVIKKAPSSEKPVGEWNQYRIVCRGDTIELHVNGVLQNRASASTVARGFIALQSEGVPIEFRNIILEPLESAAGTAAEPIARPLRERLPLMIFERVEFRQTRLADALEYVRRQSPALDPDKIGVSILLLEPDRFEEALITVSLKQVSAERLLWMLCEVAGATLRVDDQAVVIRPAPPRPVQ